MDMFECIRTRRSVRQYDPARPVSDEDLRRVLEAATWAPSGGNSQPWHFYVVRQPRLIEAMRKAIRLQCPDDPRVDAVETLFNAPCIIAVCVDVSQRFYHFKPPHLVQDLDDVYNNPDLFSVAAAIQNLLLAAHALGLGACWCKPRPVYRATLEHLVGTRPRHRLLANVALGFLSVLPPPATRKPLDEVCTFID